MRFVHLRITFSAICLIACVLLIALWVRSYWRLDELEGKLIGRKVAALSAQGKFRLDLYSSRYPPRWNFLSQRIVDLATIGLNPPEGRAIFRTKHIHFSVSPDRIFLWSYDWVPILAMAILAGAPWIPPRFSLRTMLIATTLVAVLLGLIVWAGS